MLKPRQEHSRAEPRLAEVYPVCAARRHIRQPGSIADGSFSASGASATRRGEAPSQAFDAASGASSRTRPDATSATVIPRQRGSGEVSGARWRESEGCRGAKTVGLEEEGRSPPQPDPVPVRHSSRHARLPPPDASTRAQGPAFADDMRTTPAVCAEVWTREPVLHGRCILLGGARALPCASRQQ